MDSAHALTVEQVMAALIQLGLTRPIFHSEADFQHALAWQLHQDQPAAELRLEVRPLNEISEYVDVAFRLAGVTTVLELKYLTRELRVDVDDDRFELRNQGAHDIRRYDVVNDLVRLERFVAAGASNGLAIVLTNDSGYWNTPTRTDQIDAAFRIHSGAELSGVRTWRPNAGKGTTRGRSDPLHLTGTYRPHWRPYSNVGVGAAGTFRYLVWGCAA